jgi:hypothetical protein
MVDAMSKKYSSKSQSEQEQSEVHGGMLDHLGTLPIRTRLLRNRPCRAERR